MSTPFVFIYKNYFFPSLFFFIYFFKLLYNVVLCQIIGSIVYHSNRFFFGCVRSYEVFTTSFMLRLRFVLLRQIMMVQMIRASHRMQFCIRRMCFFKRKLRVPLTLIKRFHRGLYSFRRVECPLVITLENSSFPAKKHK